MLSTPAQVIVMGSSLVVILGGSWFVVDALANSPALAQAHALVEANAEVRRRLGPAFVDRLVDPMVTGIYAGDVETLSLPACFPKLKALERDHGGLIRGMMARQKERAASRAEAEASGEAPAAARSVNILIRVLLRSVSISPL